MGEGEGESMKKLKIRKKEGSRYICTVSSDAIPGNDFDEDFSFNKHIVKIFTDEKRRG